MRRDPTDWTNASAFHAFQSLFDEVSLFLGERIGVNQSINSLLFVINGFVDLLADCLTCEIDLLGQVLNPLEQLSLVRTEDAPHMGNQKLLVAIVGIANSNERLTICRVYKGVASLKLTLCLVEHCIETGQTTDGNRLEPQIESLVLLRFLHLIDKICTEK